MDMEKAIDRLHKEDHWDDSIYEDDKPFHTLKALFLKKATEKGLFSKEDFKRSTFSIHVMQEEKEGLIYDLGAIKMTIREPLKPDRRDCDFSRSLDVSRPDIPPTRFQA